ncbi:MAG: hypothetical protein ACR2O0_12275 [Rhizobiaceae bacterium]
MRNYLTIRTLIFAAVLLPVQLIAALALACAFHVNLPEFSIGDRIINASHIVLAREDSQKPFTFSPDVMLKGDYIGQEIPLLVDSTTRRRLAVNPGDFVLLSKSSIDNQWRRLAYVKEQDRSLFEDMVAKAPIWDDEQDALLRFAFFAALHDHQHASIRKIALTELDKIPYRHLRRMPVRIPASKIREKLNDRYEIPWVPIRILMLGILGDDESKEIVKKAVEYNSRSGFGSNLGAWVTAYIEIDGSEAIDHLTQQYLLNAAAKPESVEAVLTAFALHGMDGDPELKSAINASLETALSFAPNLAASIARTFGAQQDYSHFALLQKSMNSGKLRTPHELLIVASYLSLAQKSQEPSQ